jgi:hypothetical protein
MKLLKNITPLTKQEAANIKGGYIFTCEEKKRNLMTITVYSDAGSLLNTYKVATVDADSFMTTYGTTALRTATK